jgi:uncharacterized protein YkwD
VKRAAVLAALTLALVGSLAAQASASDAAPAATERVPALDQAILLEANAVRTARGLRPLVLSRDLERAALFQSRSMLQGGFFAHESRDGTPFSARIKRFYAASGYGFWSAGENLLYESALPGAAEAVDAWMNSPPHRRNMLDPSWREVGIASVYAPTAGGMFGGEAAWVITMDFGVRQKSPAAAAKPSAPAKPKARAKV